MVINSWYSDYIERLVNCLTCQNDIRSLHPQILNGYPCSLCYLPSNDVKLMFIAEAPGLGPKNDGIETDRLSALKWMNLDEQWKYISGMNPNFMTDSFGSFVFHVIQGLKKYGFLLDPKDIAVTNCIKYPISRTHSHDSKKKLASSHQATHLCEEFQHCHPKVVLALGSTAITTVTNLKNSGEIFYNSLVKLPHPSGSHPAGRWHYESYDLFNAFLKYLHTSLVT